MVSGDPSDAEILAAMMAAPADAWDKLWSIAGALPAGPDRVSWEYPEPGEPLFFPFPLYSDAVDKLQTLVYDLGLIVSFDWMEWMRAGRYRRGDGLAAAPVAEAARLMTVFVRGERFSDGAIAGALEDGTVAAILDRVRRWFENGRCTDLGEVPGLVTGLAADPLFAASQSSKELFHSNMLAWYLQNRPEVRSRLAQAWDLLMDPDDQIMIRREQHQLDLMIESPVGHPALVVENKVFALPDEDQLHKYSTARRWPGDTTFVLLSLTDPGWPDGIWSTPEGVTWTHYSYADLATALRPAAAEISRHDQFAGEMLTRWMDLVEPWAVSLK